jgi:hypothetical protein
VSRFTTSFVLGFHGCEEEIGRKAVNGEISLLRSERQYDWLGSGSYFWEGDILRAQEWAEERRSRGLIEKPFVIGAVIDLGNCLDLLARENIALVETAYRSFKTLQEASGTAMPRNEPVPGGRGPDNVLRYLDRAVIEHLHTMIADPELNSAHLPPFDTVRGYFGEGEELYAGSGFRKKTHVQIAVRSSNSIKGIFLPRGGL